MRALGDPDAFVPTDLGVKAAARELGLPAGAGLVARSEAWRPWRAYAALHLWTADGAAATERKRNVKGGDTATNLMNDTAAVAATGA